MNKYNTFDKIKSVIGEGPDKKSYLGEDDFVVVHHRNITISYHVKNKLIDLAKLLGTVRRIMGKIEEHLGILSDQIEIEIYQSRDEWVERHTMLDEADAPSWVAGDSGRVIRLVMDEGKIAKLEELQLMVTHECVHTAVREFTNNRCPAWLDEGLATCISQNLPDEYLEALQKAIENDALMPLELLDGSFNRFDRKMKFLAYAQSFSLVEYLVSTYGWEINRELLAAYRRGDSEDAVLRKRGLNTYLLEKAWVRATANS